MRAPLVLSVLVATSLVGCVHSPDLDAAPDPVEVSAQEGAPEGKVRPLDPAGLPAPGMDVSSGEGIWEEVLEAEPVPDVAPSGGSGGIGGLVQAPARSAAPVRARSVGHDAVAWQAPAGEGFTDYGIHDFVDPQVDGLSTFAVDVDTASYAITRRALRSGHLPPAAAVRAEEFVNALPYTYRQPARGEPFAVDFEAGPSPFSPGMHLVRIGLQGRTVSVAERRPVHLTFLVDVSGSMRRDDKLGLVKRSLRMLTEELEDGDTVAIATYAGDTRVVLPPTPIREAGTILAALDGLTAGGSTAMASGMDLAYRLASDAFVPGDVNRVIVASDGDANVGATSPDEISARIRGYAEQGITLTTLGFGDGNYRDTMMERLANDGDGNYYYIDSMNEARRVLVDRMTSTLEVIAKDVKVQVAWDLDQVRAYRLIGYENRDVADRDFRNDAVDAGEIGAGHQVTALYEVALADGAQGRIATVRVRSKAPGPDAPAVERSYDFDAKAIHPTFAATSAQFRIQTAVAGFAEILRGSPHMNETTLSEILEIAREARRPDVPEDAELIELIDRAAKLRGEAAIAWR